MKWNRGLIIVGVVLSPVLSWWIANTISDLVKLNKSQTYLIVSHGTEIMRQGRKLREMDDIIHQLGGVAMALSEYHLPGWEPGPEGAEVVGAFAAWYIAKYARAPEPEPEGIDVLPGDSGWVKAPMLGLDTLTVQPRGDSP